MNDIVAQAICATCKENKDNNCFNKDKRHVNGLRSSCKLCESSYNKRWRKSNIDRERHNHKRYLARHPNYFKDYHIKAKFGVTRDEFNEMLSRQGGCCAICMVNKPGGSGNWHVDHNHKTKKVRGLLCHNCNRGIGYLRDEIEVLQLAVEYLKKNDL